jgi:hypothetical protein
VEVLQKQTYPVPTGLVKTDSLQFEEALVPEALKVARVVLVDPLPEVFLVVVVDSLDQEPLHLIDRIDFLH